MQGFTKEEIQMTNNNVKNVQLYELKERKINTRGNQNLSTQLTKTILSNNAYLLMRLLHCSIYLENNMVAYQKLQNLVILFTQDLTFRNLP